MKVKSPKTKSLEVEYVPVGIVEIVEKQEQGWTYIKGGFQNKNVTIFCI
jgi:intracellular sulfur oxidation DsrE/DsrF family protein